MKLAAIRKVSGAVAPGTQDSARALLIKAAAAGAEPAVLPEYFLLSGHRGTDKLGVQQSFGDAPIQHFLADTARSLGMWIGGATLPTKTWLTEWRRCR